MHRVRVFSYGTLITGGLSAEIDALVARYCTGRWEGWVRGRLFDLGAYPGAVRGARRDERVLGQVLELDQPEQLLPVLDRYEGFDPRAPHKSLYLRETVIVAPTDGGRPIPAWIYWLNQRPLPRRRIPSGDYRAHTGQG
jgi:gamma-glutamylcyclotransferase (GGCT)/AIG2-like uncharacterized protein YtfP